MLTTVSVFPSEETFSFGPPRELFQAPWDSGRTYDPTPNRKDTANLFMFLDSTEGQDAPISVILNWQALLVDKPRP